MLIPTFWAEASARHRADRKQFTVRRFGWSDDSVEAAQAMAQQRADEALAKWQGGDAALAKFEPKVAYNGAEGVPIREQIVDRVGAVVLTRNGYGAVCLNSPDALFADVDFDTGSPLWAQPLVMLVVLIAGGIAWRGYGAPLAIAVGFATLFVFGGLVKAWLRRRGGDPQASATARVQAFLRTHPDWRVRIYRTPAGLRLLAMQRRFDPLEPAVGEFFAAVGTDRTYVRMCQRQRCFRARVSAKPWRIGIPGHLRPRPGVWPVDPDKHPERARWLADYDRRAASFAACRFVAELGDGNVDADVALQCALHDSLCSADSELPLA